MPKGSSSNKEVKRNSQATDSLEDMVEAEFGMSPEEIKKILKNAGQSEPRSYETRKLPLRSKWIKFGVLSDTHMGHKMYRPDILKHAVKNFNTQDVEFVLMPGDILEGMSGREGHVYELSHIGASEQLDYAVSELKQIKQPIYAITATNSHDGWFSNKNNMGFEVGPELERRVDNFNFLGYDEADLVTSKGLRIRMTHPGDGTAYAISYKLQKYLNALSGGQKPHLLFEGHYHKSLYMFYRNVHAFDSGTLEGQTTFMKKKGTPAHLGYWIVEVNGDKDGVQAIRPEFTAFYE